MPGRLPGGIDDRARIHGAATGCVGPRRLGHRDERAHARGQDTGGGHAREAYGSRAASLKPMPQRPQYRNDADDDADDNKEKVDAQLACLEAHALR